MIKIYGMKGCDKCTKMIEFCEDNYFNYEYIEEQSILLEYARKHHILTAPVVQIDNNFYGFNGAMERLKNVR